MLLLSRKVGEIVVIGGDVQIKVLAVQGNRVRLGIGAPRGTVAIWRAEVPRPAEPTAEGGPSAPGTDTAREAAG